MAGLNAEGATSLIGCQETVRMFVSAQGAMVPSPICLPVASNS